MAERLLKQEWMQPCKMERIIVHWTAGSYTCSGLDKEHYHFLIDGEGKVHQGNWDVDDNVSTADGAYAAHTWQLNTGSIGVSVCCMGGPGVTLGSGGSYPMKKAQWETMARVVAELAVFYKIPITPATVLGHFEVESAYGISQDGKWDPGWLPWAPSMTMKEVGSAFRSLVSQYAAGGTSEPEAPVKSKFILKAPGKKDLTVDAILVNESLSIPARRVADHMGWRIIHADAPELLMDTDPKSPNSVFSRFDLEVYAGTGYIGARQLAECWKGSTLTWETSTKTATLTVA